MLGPEGAAAGADVPQRLGDQARVSVRKTRRTSQRALLDEDVFVSILHIERRRAERARKRFVLVLVDFKKSLACNAEDINISAFEAALSTTTRETDIIGWYLEGSTLGVIGTELGTASNEAIREKFLEKIQKLFEQALGLENCVNVFLSFHFFPEECGEGRWEPFRKYTLCCEMKKKDNTYRTILAIKRGIGILGSTFALGFLGARRNASAKSRGYI